MLDLGRVSLSFVKGKTLDNFLVSGIINENNTSYQSKIKCRIENEVEAFTSTCNCIHWSEKSHCSHAAALFLKYASHSTNPDNEIAPLYLGTLAQDAVSAERLGTLIKSPGQLQGARASSTFSSLYYTTAALKTIPFPAPSAWEGTLIIDIKCTVDDEFYSKLSDINTKCFLEYKHMLPDGTINSKISVFDNLYLFRWDTGVAYHLPTIIKELISKLKNLETFLSPNELLKHLWQFKDSSTIQLQVEGKTLNSFEPKSVLPVIWIDESQRKSFLNLKIQLLDSEKRTIMIPEFFDIFVSEGGFAGSFRTKTDSLNFLRALLIDKQDGSHQYRKYIHSSSKKHLILEWVELLNSTGTAFFYDTNVKNIYFIEVNLFWNLFSAIYSALTEVAFKTSFHYRDDQHLLFQLPKNILLQGISQLYYELNPYGVEMFFKDIQIKTWKSQIRFERKQSNLDWFELDLVVSKEEYDLISKAELGENYFFSDKGLILLGDKEKDLLKFMKKYTKLEADNKNKTGATLRFSLFLKRARIFELFELKKLGVEGALTQEEEELCHKIANLSELPQYTVPERYAELARSYQVHGYQWLRFLYEHGFGACLADDMGLGKTLQTIMLLQSLKEKNLKVLIICPVSILFNWRNELEKFSDLEYNIFYGDERDLNKNSSITLTSYGLMKKESLGEFSKINFDIIIFDEVQHLKNIRSLGAHSARQLNGKFRICLTGTPVENDLSEFYNIMDLCVPGIWGDLSIIGSQSKNKNRLIARKTVKPFILRRTKEQVLKELPEKIEHSVLLDFSDEERTFYQGRLDDIKHKMVSSELNRKYGEILKNLLELRQLCLWQKSPTFSSSKIDYLMDNLEQLMAENHKVLVFSQFTTFLDFIQNKIKEQGWKYSRIDGSQSIRRRQDEVEQFQNGDAKVFLISLKAGGFGLNLTAASYIFLMDPWWNPAVERQAIDRAHRIGQENKLTVYRPIIKGSVEEKVLLLQQSKKELFRDLMAEDEDNYFSGRLTTDDFQMLLS